jgi:hypothetical protein
MRSLLDDTPAPQPSKVSELTLSLGSALCLRVEAHGRVFVLDGRVTDTRHAGHIVVATGGTILAFTPDGRQCLTGGFGPRTTILCNRDT